MNVNQFRDQSLPPDALFLVSAHGELWEAGVDLKTVIVYPDGSVREDHPGEIENGGIRKRALVFYPS